MSKYIVNLFANKTSFGTTKPIPTVSGRPGSYFLTTDFWRIGLGNWYNTLFLVDSAFFVFSFCTFTMNNQFWLFECHGFSIGVLE